MDNYVLLQVLAGLFKAMTPHRMDVAYLFFSNTEGYQSVAARIGNRNTTKICSTG